MQGKCLWEFISPFSSFSSSPQVSAGSIPLCCKHSWVTQGVRVMNTPSASVSHFSNVLTLCSRPPTPLSPQNSRGPCPAMAYKTSKKKSVKRMLSLPPSTHPFFWGGWKVNSGLYSHSERKVSTRMKNVAERKFLFPSSFLSC